MAVALSWKGYVDTDLNFTEFFAADHTLVLRFMPQFPNTYEGPFVAENGKGTFGVGQADFLSGTAGTKLYLAAGAQKITRAAKLTRNQWHHLAVVVSVSATQRTFALYLDGTQLGQTMSVALNAAQMPEGRLRFGRRTTGQTVNGREAQAYGLLDDVAIFTRALTASQIQNLRDNVPHLKGNEKDLLAGYTFAEGQLPAKLARPITLRGGARRVTTSAKRDSASDAALLPLPTRHEMMDLPFPPGEAWSVIQGVDDAAGSHKGYASFCWDFMIADHPQGGEYPEGSDGAPFYSCAPGKVITLTQSGMPGPSNPSNIIEIEQASGEICGYLHMKQNSSEVKKDDQATMARKLGLTGDTGANIGAYHVHLAMTDKPDGTSGFVTFPIAFSDYEVRAGNKWQSVARGMPAAGEVIRIPPTPTFGPRGLQVGNAIARGPNLLDILATDTAGRVWAAHWTPSTYARNWDRWRPVLADIALLNTPVGVVARDANKLDVFIAGHDGKTYTGAWDRNVASGQWRGWWNILTGAIPAGGAVTAVSRAANKLDVFLVSTDGGVYTAAWDQNVADGKWRGWWRIGNLVAKPGSYVAAVSRHPNKLDIFVAGNDGKTYTAAWDQNVADGKWRGWWNILTGAIPAGGTITAVSRDPNKLDIFLVSTDGGIYTAAWDHNVADGKWRGWWRIGQLVSKPGAPVAAVSRDANKLDIFVAGNDGKTHTAAWDQNVAEGKWRGWWNILTGAIQPGSPVAAVSRAADKLDIFIVSTDGRIWTAAWEQNVAAGKWRGWWRIGT